MKKKLIPTCLTLGSALLFTSLFNFATAKDIKVNAIEEKSNIEVVKENVDTSNIIRMKPMLTPIDTYYETQKGYSMSNVGDIETIWNHYTGKGVTIAVIDSGIQYDHEDFFREDGTSIVSNKSAYFYLSELDNKVYKEVPVGNDYSCLKHEFFDSYNAWLDHGSNVSSTAASPINGIGTVGIAPDATLLALKVDMTDEAIKEAIKYAVDNGADVINMSLGAYDTDDPHSWDDSYPGCATAYSSEINYAYNHDVIVVAAAGNETTSAKSYPACNDHVIGVGALAANSDTRAASYSNFNKSTDSSSTNHNVDLMAPGTVYVAGLNESESSDKDKYPSNSYHVTQGTSFASPIVAGAAALWKEKYNGNPDDFESDLFSRCVDMGSYQKYGNGRLDVYKLLDLEHDDFLVSSRHERLNLFNTQTVQITASSKSSTVKSWEVTDNTVASISYIGVGTNESVVTVTPLKEGNTTLIAKDNIGNTIEISIEVYFYQPHVVSVQLSHTRKIVGVNQTFQLVATVSPDTVVNKEVTWSSEDNSIATIDQNGVITGKKVGRTYVTARSVDNPKAFKRCEVTILEIAPIFVKGCSGEIMTTSITLSIIAFLGISVLSISLFKKKRSN